MWNIFVQTSWLFHLASDHKFNPLWRTVLLTERIYFKTINRNVTDRQVKNKVLNALQSAVRYFSVSPGHCDCANFLTMWHWIMHAPRRSVLGSTRPRRRICVGHVWPFLYSPAGAFLLIFFFFCNSNLGFCISHRQFNSVDKGVKVFKFPVTFT